MYADGRYLHDNPTWHTEDSPYKARCVIDTLNRRQVAFSTCADLGCGAGLVTELLAKHYPQQQFFGYELSPDAQALIEQRQKLQNLHFFQQDIFAQNTHYDLIVCLDVFEHVEDYFGFLRSLKSRADKFVFNIPLDMNVMKLLSAGLKYAREEVGHLHYFNRYTALATLQDCGYRIKSAQISAAFLKTPPRNRRQAAILPLRCLSVLLGKRAAALLFGGVSLLVYAE